MAATKSGTHDVFEQRVIAGSEHLRQGQMRAAQKELMDALAMRPGDPKALALLGLSYFRGGQFAEARPIYEELVANAGQDASHRMNLGLVNLKLGDADSAIVQLEKSRDLDPSQGRAVSYLGLAYARAGRFVEAYQRFLMAHQDDLAKEIEEQVPEAERQRILDELRVESLAAAGVVEEAPPVEPSSSESQQFVSPALLQVLDQAPTAAVAEPSDARTAISRAVDRVSPSSAMVDGGTRVAMGSTAPQSISALVTERLIRPEDGDYPFEIAAAGVLIVRVNGKIYSRTEGIDVTGGRLAYEVAMRRSRGASTQEPFDSGGRQMFLVAGKGHLIASPLGEKFTAVQLDDDILYLREQLVFAFEAGLRWENGHVPGSNARIGMVQFRGSGAVVFRTTRPLLAVKLQRERTLYVDAGAIAGWVGRVVPRAVAPAGDGNLAELFVECSGEGVVLVQEETSPTTQVAPPRLPS